MNDDHDHDVPDEAAEDLDETPERDDHAAGATPDPHDDGDAEDDVGDDVGDAATRRRAGRDRAAGGPALGERVPVPLAAVGAFAVLLALLAGWFFLVRDDDALGDDVVVRVDGVSLTVDEFERRLQATEVLYGIPAPEAGTPEAVAYRRDFAQAEALRLVFEHEAADRGVVIAQRQVQDALARLIEEQYPVGGRDTFIARLGDAGVSEAEVLDELRRGLVNQALFNDVVDAAEITDAEVRVEYDALGDALQVGETRRLRHAILATEEEANAALARIEGGEAFADVAAEVSLDASTSADGGLIGTLEEAQLDPAFAEPAFRASVGEAFGPVETDLGWHLGVVDEILPARTLALDEVLEPLRTNIVFRCQQGQWRSFIADAIRSADIDYSDAYRPENPDEPPPLTLAPSTSEMVDGVPDADDPATPTTLADQLADPSICGSDG